MPYGNHGSGNRKLRIDSSDAGIFHLRTDGSSERGIRCWYDSAAEKIYCSFSDGTRVRSVEGTILRAAQFGDTIHNSLDKASIFAYGPGHG